MRRGVDREDGRERERGGGAEINDARIGGPSLRESVRRVRQRRRDYRPLRVTMRVLAGPSRVAMLQQVQTKNCGMPVFLGKGGGMSVEPTQRADAMLRIAIGS